MSKRVDPSEVAESISPDSGDSPGTLSEWTAIMEVQPTLAEVASILVLNAEVGPDPRMEGTTDCYLIALDDYDALVAALARIGQ